MKHEVFLTPDHYLLKDIIRLSSTRINQILRELGKNPNDRNFEAKMSAANFWSYLQKILVGQIDEPCTQEVYDNMVNMVRQLHDLGKINMLKEPIEIITQNVQKTTLPELPQEIVVSVEEHIEAHEQSEAVEVIATMADPVGVPELGIVEEPKKKKSKTKV